MPTTQTPFDPTQYPWHVLPLQVQDEDLRRELIHRRQVAGSDHYDEVWEGTYVMSPLAGDDHQRIVARFAMILELVVGVPGLGDVRPGINVSDRDEGWQLNFRIPDVAVRLAGGAAQIRESHWRGGPDFLIEVLSSGDRAREKLAFYAAIATREVLVVDRAPWSLELYRLQGDRLVPVGVSRTGDPTTLRSEVVPLTFRLIDQDGRARIEVEHPPAGGHWLI